MEKPTPQADLIIFYPDIGRMIIKGSPIEIEPVAEQNAGENSED